MPCFFLFAVSPSCIFLIAFPYLFLILLHFSILLPSHFILLLSHLFSAPCCVVLHSFFPSSLYLSLSYFIFSYCVFFPAMSLLLSCILPCRSLFFLFSLIPAVPFISCLTLLTCFLSFLLHLCLVFPCLYCPLSLLYYLCLIMFSYVLLLLSYLPTLVSSLNCCCFPCRSCVPMFCHPVFILSAYFPVLSSTLCYVSLSLHISLPLLLSLSSFLTYLTYCLFPGLSCILISQLFSLLKFFLISCSVLIAFFYYIYILLLIYCLTIIAYILFMPFLPFIPLLLTVCCFLSLSRVLPSLLPSVSFLSVYFLLFLLMLLLSSLRCYPYSCPYFIFSCYLLSSFTSILLSYLFFSPFLPF